MDPDSDPSRSRLHVVNDLGNVVAVRSSAIQRESERAVYLEEALTPIGGYYPKRLFIKGVDLIARNEEEALRLYLTQIKIRLADMEKTVGEFRQRLEAGTEQLRRLTKKAEKTDSGPVPERRG